MFGKPQWYRIHENGRRLVANCLRGKLHNWAWRFAISLPALALLVTGRFPEAFVWGVASLVAKAFNTRELRRQIHAAHKQDELFVIDENETLSAEFATQGYHLRAGA